jgi:hypothetical protein
VPNKKLVYLVKNFKSTFLTFYSKNSLNTLLKKIKNKTFAKKLFFYFKNFISQRNFKHTLNHLGTSGKMWFGVLFILFYVFQKCRVFLAVF